MNRCFAWTASANCALLSLNSRVRRATSDSSRCCWRLIRRNRSHASVEDGKCQAEHFEAAQDLDGLDRQKEALSHARIATELDPHNSNMWFFRGVLERQRADFAEAVASQTRSIEIAESPIALSEREQCERRLGKTAEADADLRRIQELKR